MAQLSTVGQDSPKSVEYDREMIAEVATPVFAAANSFQQTFLKNMMAYQKEWVGFLNTRLHENMAMPARLSGCKSLPEVQQVYIEYCKRTIDQYSHETQSLREIAAAINKAGGSGVSEKANSAVTDVVPMKPRLDS